MKQIILEKIGMFEYAAMAEDGRILDLLVEGEHHRSIVGNIYLGLIKNILPGQFAFVDIGQSKNAFLNIDDSPKERRRTGENLLVQVSKDTFGDKGASISAQLSLTGRLSIIYESDRGEIGVSRRIKSEQERNRLKKAALSYLPKGLGVIMRTDSENKSEDAIAADLIKIIAVLNTIREKGPLQKPPALVYENNSMLNELLREDVDEIIVSDPARLSDVLAEAESRIAGAGERVRLAERGFSDDLMKQIARALEKKIWLNSGGYLTIEQTEACVIIDVNSGKYIGGKGNVILQTNTEAAREVAAQIRLRNLTGMIIVDFINMDSKQDQRTLFNLFQAEIAPDRIKVNIIGMTELGLMQLTRRKTRDSLQRILSTECPVCHGSGTLPLGGAPPLGGDKDSFMRFT